MIAVLLWLSGSVLSTLLLIAAAPACAQDWSVVPGVASRVEYSDNYFFTATGDLDGGPESALTLSVIPFVAAARRTEVSDVTALVAIGGNKVFGLSPSEEYLSARMSLDATLRQERGTWTAFATYTRSPGLENVVRGDAVFLALNYTDTASVGGGYQHQLDENWSVGVSANAFANRYDGVDSVDTASDSDNFAIGGVLRQRLSDRTQLQYALDYSYSTSDLTRDQILAARVAILHRFSPGLRVSAAGSWYRSRIHDRAASSELPSLATPAGDESGWLFGGGLQYLVAEGTEFTATFSQELAPSGVGTTSRNDYGGIGLSHRFSDQLTAYVGASYARTTFPDSVDGAYSDRTVRAQAGLSWQIAQRWKLDAGYQYARTRYSPDNREPTSNVVFVSIGYNWPGASLTGWIGRTTQSPSLTGAGPVVIHEQPGGYSGATSTTQPPDALPFEPFTLP